MAPELASSVLLATGALLVTVGLVAGLWVGRAITDPTGAQVRQTIRELGQIRKDLQRQLAAARDEVSALVQDPRTREDTRLRLEERVLPRLTERRRGEC